MKTVFFDVDTQLDFVFPAGALYVPGAETILDNIARLNRFAVQSGATLISTVDAHTENDPEFLHWPAHCVVGTAGQQKPAATLVDGDQRIFPKVTTNAFADGKLDRLLDEIGGVDRFVVYGVVTEICVEAVVRGLMRRGGGARIEVVSDAVRHLDESKAEALFSEVRAAGGVVTDAAQVIR